MVILNIQLKLWLDLYSLLLVLNTEFLVSMNKLELEVHHKIIKLSFFEDVNPIDVAWEIVIS